MEKVVFLSHVLNRKTPAYGGKRDLSFRPVREMARGDTCNTMVWSLGNHSGTHVDAPRHVLKNGKTLDKFSAGSFVFEKVALVTMKGVRPGQILGFKEIGALPSDTELVLIKTGFERFRGRRVYWENGPGLSPDMAEGLRRRCPRIRAVGMDVLSVSSFQNREIGRKAHREFLRRNILLIEDMKLSPLRASSPGRVLLAPVRVQESDAAPCSVWAWRRS